MNRTQIIRETTTCNNKYAFICCLTFDEFKKLWRVMPHLSKSNMAFLYERACQPCLPGKGDEPPVPPGGDEPPPPNTQVCADEVWDRYCKPGVLAAVELIISVLTYVATLLPPGKAKSLIAKAVVAGRYVVDGCADRTKIESLVSQLCIFFNSVQLVLDTCPQFIREQLERVVGRMLEQTKDWRNRCCPGLLPPANETPDPSEWSGVDPQLIGAMVNRLAGSAPNGNGNGTPGAGATWTDHTSGQSEEGTYSAATNRYVEDLRRRRS
jgi:hypothetical protein